MQTGRGLVGWKAGELFHKYRMFFSHSEAMRSLKKRERENLRGSWVGERKTPEVLKNGEKKGFARVERQLIAFEM